MRQLFLPRARKDSYAFQRWRFWKCGVVRADYALGIPREWKGCAGIGATPESRRLADCLGERKVIKTVEVRREKNVSRYTHGRSMSYSVRSIPSWDRMHVMSFCGRPVAFLKHVNTPDAAVSHLIFPDWHSWTVGVVVR